MPLIKDPHLFNEQSLFVDLIGVLGCPLYLKNEVFNFAGSSIKLKPAREVVERAEREGLICPGSVLVESSSGNLDVALSMIAASKAVHGAMSWLADHDARDLTAVAISPDMGRPRPVSEPQHPARVPVAGYVATAALGNFLQ